MTSTNTEIRIGSTVTGPTLPEPIDVLATAPMGASLKIIGRGRNTGMTHDPVFTPAQLDQLQVSAEREPFDGDARMFRLGIEDHRLGLAYEYDPFNKLGQITSSMTGCLLELYVNELSRTDEITSGVGANRLLKYWPPALTEWSTKGVRDAFFSSPQLPRLLDADTIKRTIADGVSHRTLGYATKDAKGQLKLMHFNESLGEAAVEIAYDVYLLKAEDAQKLLEPPRLNRVAIRPTEVALKPGEHASFSCGGVDQYGEPFAIGAAKWSATSGEVTDEGLYAAAQDSTGGLFTVKAVVDGLEAIAEVRVVLSQGPGGGPGGSDDEPESREKAIR